MKQRPWIWLVIANVLFISGIVTLVTVAIRHREPEVPVVHGR
jgi:hypothetical protein